LTKTKFLEILEGSLNNYLRVNDLRVSQLMKMCYDIAKGMAYLEKNNVIHR
jgi:serine/threonine protein kinase